MLLVFFNCTLLSSTSLKAKIVNVKWFVLFTVDNANSGYAYPNQQYGYPGQQPTVLYTGGTANVAPGDNASQPSYPAASQPYDPNFTAANQGDAPPPPPTYTQVSCHSSGPLCGCIYG